MFLIWGETMFKMQHSISISITISSLYSHTAEALGSRCKANSIMVLF